jgi:uncharacterized protein (DUF697 family)
MTETATKTAEANDIIRNYMLGTLAVGIIPIPLVDLAILSGIQLKMLHSLARLYAVEFSGELGKSLIASLLGGGVPVNLAGLLKRILPYGFVTSIIGTSVFGGASTYAVGKVFIQHFESGGTFLNFDPQQVKDYYAKQFEKGKEEVKSFAGIKP